MKSPSAVLEEQLMNSEIVDKATRRLFELVDAEKTVIIGDEREKVPENNIRLQAATTLIKLQREIAKENPADPDGAYVDTFWQDWYKSEYGADPTPADLKRFKGENIEVEAEEIQERLFSSEPIKKGTVSFDPKDFTDDE